MQLIATPTFGYTDAQTGHFSPMETQKNLIVYQAADIVAGLLAGNMSCKLSHMYFQYQNVNGSVSVTPTLTQSSGIADFKAITGGAPYASGGAPCAAGGAPCAAGGAPCAAGGAP